VIWLDTDILEFENPEPDFVGEGSRNFRCDARANYAPQSSAVRGDITLREFLPITSR